MKVMTTTPAAVSPQALWLELQAQAGLELRRSRGVPGRDADLEAALIAQLFLGRPEGAVPDTLHELLQADAASAAPRVSVESLLVAVLTAQRGYAAMMRGILDTLVLAQASSAHALDIEFRFDAVSDPIRLTLEQFRETTRRVESVLESRYAMPTDDEAWRVAAALRHAVRQQHGSLDARDAQGDPSLPSTGDAPLDGLLAELHALAEEFRTWRLKLDAISGSGAPAAAHGISPEDVNSRRSMINDSWDAGIQDSLIALALDVREGRVPPEAAIDVVRAAAAPLPTRAHWVQTTVSALSDLLQLPAWRRRHELYAVWVGCVLLRTARERASDLHFHSPGGVLSFAFGGSRLATYRWQEADFDIWAEMRSELVGTSRRRKRAIQPDFRVLEVSLSGSVARRTRFVLECKHYLDMRADHFVEAASDYARSCPAAQVLLVNHGPADVARLAVAPTLSSRVRFIGHATAQLEQADGELAAAIQEALFAAGTAPAQTTEATTAAAPGVASGETAVGDGAPSETMLDGTALVPAPAVPAASVVLSWNLLRSAPVLSLRVTRSSLPGGGVPEPADVADGVQMVQARDIEAQLPGQLTLDLPREPEGRYRIEVITTDISGRLCCEIRIDGQPSIREWPRTGGPSVFAIAYYDDPWHVATADVSAGQARLLLES
jgi:hypothetical protein